LLVGAIALLAAACGDDDDDDDDNGEATPTATAEATEEPTATATEEPAETGEQLKIAFLADFSGPLAEFGPVIQTGVELAIQHINAAGGVNGQDVVFVTGDTQVDPTQGVEEARRLVEVEEVAAIVGPLSSTVTIAVAESVTGDAEVPTISPSATSPGVTVAADNGFLFRSTTSDAAQGVVLADLATDEEIENIGVIFRDDAYGQGLSDAFQAAFEQESHTHGDGSVHVHGGTATLASYSAAGQPSYLAELQQAADGGADVLVAIGFPAEAEVFLRESIENDIFTQFLFVDGTKSLDLIEALGAEALEGFKGTAPGSAPVPEASTVAWNDAYQAEYGELPTLPFVREAYDATIAIALAAELSSTTNGVLIRDGLAIIGAPPGEVFLPGPEGVAAALAAVRNGDDINYEGGATTLNWNADGDVTTGFIEIWQFSGGDIESLEMVPFSLE
jgi:ABC-type branched-subunit amino acid transport system substrate-binding protein